MRVGGKWSRKKSRFSEASNKAKFLFIKMLVFQWCHAFVGFSPFWGCLCHSLLGPEGSSQTISGNLGVSQRLLPDHISPFRSFQTILGFVSSRMGVASSSGQKRFRSSQMARNGLGGNKWSTGLMGQKLSRNCLRCLFENPIGQTRRRMWRETNFIVSSSTPCIREGVRFRRLLLPCRRKTTALMLRGMFRLPPGPSERPWRGANSCYGTGKGSRRK